MANVDLKSNIVIFSQNDYESAWENSPVISNKEKDKYRLCYICKFPFEKEFNDLKSTDESAWVIDLINIKKPVLNFENYIGVHGNCVDNKTKKDARKLLKRIKLTQWQSPE